MTAKRFNRGKPQLSLPLSATKALSGMASVMEFGAEKYGRDNWKDGLPMTEIADSLARHLTAWLNGETTDEESGLPHLHHMAVNALFMAEFNDRADLDNREVAEVVEEKDAMTLAAEWVEEQAGVAAVFNEELRKDDVTTTVDCPNVIYTGAYGLARMFCAGEIFDL